MRYRNSFEFAKFVPFTAVEWNEIQQVFQSNNVLNIKKACNILNMWKFRMGNNTPVFIDISQLILSSLIIDDGSTKHLRPSNEIRLIYASVIIRFVNYVNEICQPDGSKLLSIAAAVSSVGIPGWIVSVRHEATHCQMPSINLMREALLFCRDWLWRHQWARKFNEAVKELPKEVFEIERNKRQALILRRIHEVFELFHTWRNRNSSVRELTIKQREVSPFKQMLINLSNHTDEFIQIFVKNCLSKRLKISTKNSKLNYNEVSENEQLYYFPVMQMLNDKNVLPSLLLEITRNIANSALSERSRSILSGWADKLLSAFLQTGSPRFATISDQTWKLILKHVVLAPQYFNDDQVEKILAYMKTKILPKSYAQLVKLLKMGDKLYDKSGFSFLEDENFNFSTYSVLSLDDLQYQINMNSTFKKDPLTGEQDWSFADKEDLGPLGLTSTQAANTFNLALDEKGNAIEEE